MHLPTVQLWWHGFLYRLPCRWSLIPQALDDVIECVGIEASEYLEWLNSEIVRKISTTFRGDSYMVYIQVHGYRPWAYIGR